MARRFDGDFDLLAFTSAILYADVPRYPTDSDFHLAATDAANDGCAEADWRLEAIRERRMRPGCELDAATMKAIAVRTADRIYKRDVVEG